MLRKRRKEKEESGKRGIISLDKKMSKMTRFQKKKVYGGDKTFLYGALGVIEE